MVVVVVVVVGAIVVVVVVVVVVAVFGGVLVVCLHKVSEVSASSWYLWQFVRVVLIVLILLLQWSQKKPWPGANKLWWRLCLQRPDPSRPRHLERNHRCAANLRWPPLGRCCHETGLTCQKLFSIHKIYPQRPPTIKDMTGDKTKSTWIKSSLSAVLVSCWCLSFILWNQLEDLSWDRLAGHHHLTLRPAQLRIYVLDVSRELGSHLGSIAVRAPKRQVHSKPSCLNAQCEHKSTKPVVNQWESPA